jgi:transcriptional regulator with XRE-family HTH domain
VSEENNANESFSVLPDLKSRIVTVLSAKNLTYKQLVEHLGSTEEELDRALAESTIEIRTLELISKELRIPLYSFFRDPSLELGDSEQPFYNVNIWAPQEIQLRTENENLRQEIDRLRVEVARKELLIQGLEEQLKK